jgi:hypothetical protein
MLFCWRLPTRKTQQPFYTCHAQINGCSKRWQCVHGLNSTMASLEKLESSVHLEDLGKVTSAHNSDAVFDETVHMREKMGQRARGRADRMSATTTA